MELPTIEEIEILEDQDLEYYRSKLFEIRYAMDTYGKKDDKTYLMLEEKLKFVRKQIVKLKEKGIIKK